GPRDRVPSWQRSPSSARARSMGEAGARATRPSAFGVLYRPREALEQLHGAVALQVEGPHTALVQKRRRLRAVALDDDACHRTLPCRIVLLPRSMFPPPPRGNNRWPDVLVAITGFARKTSDADRTVRAPS